MTVPVDNPESVSPQAKSNPVGNGFTARLGVALRRVPQRRSIQLFVVALLVLPAIISGIYMWTMWDPELYLKDVPVAVSTDDAGGTSDGKFENLGQQILDDMTSSGELQFHKVSSAEAVKGIKETRYAFALIIPRDFTKKIYSVTDSHPQKPRISVYFNDFNGTLGPAVATSVIAQAQKEIAATIGEGYAKGVLLGLNQLGDGLKDASVGGKQLKDGTKQLKDGTSQLANGINQVADGVGQLKNGSGQLHAGTTQLSDGTGQLVTGTKELGSGATQIRDGVGGIITPLLAQLEPLSKNVAALMPAVDALALNSDATIRAAATQLKSLLNELNTEAPNSTIGQLAQLRNGTVELARQLNDPKAEYLSGVLSLNTGAKQLNEGAKQLDDGLGELHKGMPDLKNGAAALKKGSRDLDTGASQLSSGLSDGSAQAPHIDDVPASANMFAAPMNVSIDNLQPSQKVINNDRSHKEIDRGAGPVIVVLGAFLLSILMWMVLSPSRGNNNYASALKRAAMPTLRGARLGALGGIIFGLLLTSYGALIGWNPHNWASMLPIVMLVGVTAAVSTQLFVVVFGRVYGSIISFVFFMYQIFAFGGIFPLGTTPPAFRPFRDIAPMTYAHRALLRTHLSLYDNMFWISILALVIMSMAAIVIGVAMRYLLAQADRVDELNVASRGRTPIAGGTV
ncbi:YhgE/Pip family protein [Gordonia sp. CPCC 205333]|uniref:YhgE/Pip family protein n=1 Tax=Gordonia sp. CPCC 205333 TaxID=3140790 RepID=UPI003AF37A64